VPNAETLGNNTKRNREGTPAPTDHEDRSAVAQINPEHCRHPKRLRYYVKYRALKISPGFQVGRLHDCARALRAAVFSILTAAMRQK